MKCPECGCENEDDYRFCKKCGTPQEQVIEKIDPIRKSNPSNKNKKYVILGIFVIIIVAIMATGLNSLDIGGIEPGNEAIININQDSFLSSATGKYVYEISFTLTNAPKQAESYYVKATWYDNSGNVVLSKSHSLEYSSIEEDNTMDVYVQAESTKQVSNITKCIVEITDNQGELVTSTYYNWLNS